MASVTASTTPTTPPANSGQGGEARLAAESAAAPTVAEDQAEADSGAPHTGSLARRMMLIAAGWIAILLLLGGLLTAACMLQRPDLFGAVYSAVGVHDMLRFHRFTIGYHWISEYGSSAVRDQFVTLLRYSPLHNVRANVGYPPILLATADHDDRVVPAHSFKFISALQEAHQGENPVLIRVETDAGHGAGKPTHMIIAEQADKWAFFFQNVDHKPNYEFLDKRLKR